MPLTQWCSRRTSQQLVGETVQGRVKSFRSGWGFVNSSRFEGDVFVGVKANKHLEPLGLQPNELVQFELAADDTQSGIHAIRVRGTLLSPPR